MILYLEGKFTTEDETVPILENGSIRTNYTNFDVPNLHGKSVLNIVVKQNKKLLKEIVRINTKTR